MTSMEKGTIKLTVKFPNQQIKDQKVILCASQDAGGKSAAADPNDTEAPTQPADIEQLASDLSCSMKDLEKHEDDSHESTSSASLEKNVAPEPEEPSTSKGAEATSEKPKENFSWDARTFANFSEQQMQTLNEYQRVWIQQAYQNYLAQHMYYYSSLGLNAPNSPGFTQPQNFFPYYRGNHTIRSDQQQAADPQQNGTTNQDNQSNTNNNNNNNNVQNNNHVEDNADNLDNRDWLDNFYMLSRVIILFSIVYFYSSPLRFMIVTLLGFMIYLYHHGFFRPHQIMPPNNENNAAANAENNEVNQEEENQAPGNQPQPPQNQTANERETVNGTTDGDNENNEERPGVAALAWIFLSSFFASLIPD